MKFSTIGHGGRVPEEFTGLLALHGIRAIAAVDCHRQMIAEHLVASRGWDAHHIE